MKETRNPTVLAASSVYVIKGQVRWIKEAVALASAVDALIIC